MKNKYWVYLLILSFVFQNCNKAEEIEPASGTGETVPQPAKNLNISILLDLSDRISPVKYPTPSMEIYNRDLGYIASISAAFETHLRNSKIRQTNDNIQVFFEPEPMNSAINTLSQKMKLSFTKNNISKNAISEISPIYKSSSKNIYDLALNDKKFVGSDIWSFFKNKAADYCVLPKHRNILIILTDGYMYHVDNQIIDKNQTTYLTPEFIRKSKLNVSNYKDLIAENHFGFIPARENLQDLEVVVLGINAEKGRAFEEDIIIKYWSDWLEAMGVKKFYIKGADLPSNLDPVIKNIILQK
ncbi:hypothetical protein KSK37_00560 [Kaistella sp. DKR-2]|uniref:hypothetical protein n=1 Tax=Kaistella soli TaxID=2849654 RepID=UPI001C27EBF8|nr:hypothetical protein [Kaistella soli]MBU8881567.1 hypothetical protein [Kaistella soli]